MESTAQEATVRSLMSRDLVGDLTRELSMITIEYPPGSVDPVHTHHAQALVYVLEGTIVMQVRGGAPVTLAPGQTFYEGPDDVHIVVRRREVRRTSHPVADIVQCGLCVTNV